MHQSNLLRPNRPTEGRSAVISAAPAPKDPYGIATREEVFQRIMRKLQHQSNYSEASTTSLAQQALGTPPPSSLAPPQPSAGEENDSAAAKPSKPPQFQPGQRLTKVSSDEFSGGASPQQRAASSQAACDFDDDEERKFGMQPCPPTLRLVVEYVQSTIHEKLRLAHVGSLWETMRFVFESRTLLDKLLKEVTQHNQFHDTGREGGGSVVKVQEIYQELRKIPVILPTTQYALDDATGRYVPEMKAPPTSTTTQLQRTAASKQQQEGVLSPTTSHPAHDFSSVTSPKFSPQPPPGSKLAPTAAHAPSYSGGGALSHQHPEMFAFSSIKDRKDHDLLMKHLRRKTQFEDRGVQTDESNLTIILREQYVSLGKHCADVEMELENKKGEIKELRDQVAKVTTQLEHKAKVVQYLRNTLFKETCVLRQQLAAAQQKQLLMQQQHQLISQQIFAQVQNVGSGGQHGAVAQLSSSGNPPPIPNFNAALVQDDTVDMTSVSSVIDLAMLGVEKNRVLNRTAAEVYRISAASGGLISSNPAALTSAPPASSGTAAVDAPLLLPNIEVQQQKLREELQMRTFKWKRELAAMRSKFAIVVSEKNKQIRSIQLASDVKNLRSILLSQVSSIRQDYGALRKLVRDQLSSMRNTLLSGLAEAEYSIKMISDAMDASSQQELTAAAQRELIVSCRDLFVPMMTLDYAIGSHVWLSKHRATDPLLHAMQMKFAPDLISTVAEELEMMHYTYQQLQKFVLRSFAIPQIAHPTTGPMLIKTIQMLIADVSCSGDLLMQLRSCLQIEYELTRKLAKINFKIKVTTWKQQTAQDCAIRALKEMGIDDKQAVAGPTHKVINRLAMQTTTLQAVKADTQRQRMSNAKEVHRIWRESTLDPFRGRRPIKIREPVLHSISAGPLASGPQKRQRTRPSPSISSPSSTVGFGTVET